MNWLLFNWYNRWACPSFRQSPTCLHCLQSLHSSLLMPKHTIQSLCNSQTPLGHHHTQHRHPLWCQHCYRLWNLMKVSSLVFFLTGKIASWQTKWAWGRPSSPLHSSSKSSAWAFAAHSSSSPHSPPSQTGSASSARGLKSTWLSTTEARSAGRWFYNMKCTTEMNMWDFLWSFKLWLVIFVWTWRLCNDSLTHVDPQWIIL